MAAPDIQSQSILRTSLNGTVPTVRVMWEVTEQDAATVSAFVEDFRDNGLVKYRIKRNIEERPQSIDRADFWRAVVSCLLTTQQRSGPSSAVMRFVNSDPFPLTLVECQACSDVHGKAEQLIKEFGGIRRGPTIAKELAGNLEWLDELYWPQVNTVLDKLLNADSPTIEREAAEFIDHQFYGFGPKQSRNLLQMLGLTRYEIPLDSRVAKWLNKFGFPVKVSAAALADEHVYQTSERWDSGAVQPRQRISLRPRRRDLCQLRRRRGMGRLGRDLVAPR
jgi:hypothetical protein